MKALSLKGFERYIITAELLSSDFPTCLPFFVCHGPGHLKRLSLRSGISGLPCGVCSN